MRRGGGRSERGVVLVWFAMMMVVLIGIGALALDFSHWFFVGTRAQKAADAASLAGAVFLPDDATTGASTALDIAKTNGFGSGVTATPVPGQPNQMKVTVTTTVKNLFAGVLGFDTQTISRTAIAEFERPVALGSPCNLLGKEPETGQVCGSLGAPKFWAAAAGGTYPKEYGDAILSKRCTGPTPPPGGPDNCLGGINSDHLDAGYYYAVRATHGGTVSFDVFDPAFVNTSILGGQNCHDVPFNVGPMYNNLKAASQLPANFPDTDGPHLPLGVTDPGSRYVPVTVFTNPADPGFRYCTGDTLMNVPATDPNPPAPATTFTVLGPARVPGHPETAPATPVCTKTFGGVKGDLAAAVQLRAPVAGNVNVSEPLASYWRKWYTLCTHGVNAGDDYFIQVTTDAGNGENNFSLRAALSGGAQATVFGNERMAIFANLTAPTSFYLARVTPASINRVLTLRFYDLGDASSAGTISISPPSAEGGQIGPGTCTYSQPFNSSGPSGSGCSFSVNSTQYNARWVQVEIPIPKSAASHPGDPTYNCDFSRPDGCWFTITFTYPPGSTVYDTSTWTAFLSGDPVRIVK